MILLPRLLSSLYASAAFLLLVTTCSVNHITDGGTETGNAKIVGKLYQPDGKTPAANARVSIRPRNTLANISGLIGLPKIRNVNIIVTTDSCGNFRFDSTLDTGTFVIEASSGTNAALIDSIVVADNGPADTLPPDTLKPAGSITGVIRLTEGGDPRKVFILAFGIDRFALPDTNGRFSFDSLAEATYDLRLLTSIDDYDVLDTFDIPVRSGRATDLDTIELPYSGLPSPKGLSATYDTLHGCVVLTWKPVKAANLAGYVVFRNDTVSKVPVRLSDKLVNDTVFIDTIFSTITEITSGTLAYRIKTQDMDANVSAAFSKAIVISAPSPEKVRTLIAFGLFGTHTDSASINDTVGIVVSYRNETRKNVKLEWFNGTNDSSIRSIALSAPTGDDTLRISWSDIPLDNLKWVSAAITDDGGAVWRESKAIRIIQDVPIVNAGRDTVIYPGDTAFLHGMATQQFGTIVKWKWKIGSGSWSETSGPDTFFVVPTENRGIVCSLSVTDDDGNSASDPVRIRPLPLVKSTSCSKGYSYILTIDSILWGCGEGRVFYADQDLGSLNRPSAPAPLMKNVKSTSAGDYHRFILTTDGTLWAFGWNYFGALGDGTMTDRTDYPIPVLSDVQSMSAGNHSLILKTDNTLWACGYNKSGQLGKDTATICYPTPVMVMSDVQNVSAGGGGYRHSTPGFSLILKTDKTLWVCGSNAYGQLGDGTTTDRATPVQIMSEVQKIATGDKNSFFIKTDGTLWACGSNAYGQFGDGTTTDHISPIMVMADVQDISVAPSHTLFLKTDGTLWASGKFDFNGTPVGPAPVQIMLDVQNVSTCVDHSLVIKRDGTLWAFGDNNKGQLGIPYVSWGVYNTPVQIILPELQP